jgi:hypothetical protein
MIMIGKGRAIVTAVFAVLLPFSASGLAQDLSSMPASSDEQWKVFVDEIQSPLLPGAAFFNATTSELTRSVPHYGGETKSYMKRFAASAADDAAQDFFSDYVMASLLREDTRYRRLGAGHTFWARMGHAAGSGFVARSFSGERTINWSNITGSAIGAAFSNAYYPAADRRFSVTIGDFGQNVVGAGLGNLAPEFWPDFRRFLARHHLFPSETK